MVAWTVRRGCDACELCAIGRCSATRLSTVYGHQQHKDAGLCVYVWMCMFVPKTRVVRAGYVVDLNVWGGVLRVLAGDPGGQTGGVASWLGIVQVWTCERVEMERESAVRRGQSYASFSSLELGPHLVPLRKSGGLEGELEGTVSLFSQGPRPTGLRRAPACPKVRPFWIICPFNS